jgi:hypothetical protein
MPSTPRVSCTVIAVTTDSGWQPMLANVRMSACSPAPPVGSDAANVSTMGGNRFRVGRHGGTAIGGDGKREQDSAAT